MKAFLALAGLAGTLFVSLPIWLYLLYKILQAVNATDLMWFLFYIYLPITILMHIFLGLLKLIDD